LTSQTHALIKP